MSPEGRWLPSTCDWSRDSKNRIRPTTKPSEMASTASQ